MLLTAILPRELVMPVTLNVVNALEILSRFVKDVPPQIHYSTQHVLINAPVATFLTKDCVANV